MRCIFCLFRLQIPLNPFHNPIYPPPYTPQQGCKHRINLNLFTPSILTHISLYCTEPYLVPWDFYRFFIGWCYCLTIYCCCYSINSHELVMSVFYHQMKVYIFILILVACYTDTTADIPLKRLRIDFFFYSISVFVYRSPSHHHVPFT